MKEKYNAEGTFEKLKARLVGMGNYENRENYDYDDISSPTVALKSVFITAAIAAEESRDVVTGDIPAAYLNAEIIEDIYMKINSEVWTMSSKVLYAKMIS
jgi:hypothetical protein